MRKLKSARCKNLCKTSLIGKWPTSVCSIISLITHLAHVLCLNTLVNDSNPPSRIRYSARIITMYAARSVRLFAQRNARERLRHLLFRRNTERILKPGRGRMEKKKRERERDYVVQLRSRGIGRKRKSPKLICIPCRAASNLSRVKQAEF